MKTFLSILCSVALTLCFALPTFASGNEATTSEPGDRVEADAKGKSEVQPQEEQNEAPAPSQGWFSSLTQQATGFVTSYLKGSQPAQNAVPSEVKKEAPVAEVKAASPRPTQTTFDRVAKRQFLITAGLATAATGLNYYCSGGGCYGSQLAQGIAGSAPALVGYLALSTGIAYFTLK